MVKSAFSIIFSAMFIGNGRQYPAPVATITGTVLYQKDRKPLENTYVYIVAGEEEAVTDKKGKFLITTWQSFPLTIVVEHQHCKRIALKIDKPGSDLSIILNKK